MSRFATVVADPPWPYRNPGEFTSGGTPIARGGGSVARYGSMELDEILSLDVAPLVADDAHLYLWTTNAFIPQAHEVARAWGFRPITMLTWMKTTEQGLTCRVCKDERDRAGEGPQPLEIGTVRVSPGTGYYYRGSTEHVLFGVKGSLKLRTPDALPTGFFWKRKPHSVKPDAFYDLVEYASPGPYLELFARRNRLGWETYGDQALEHVVMGDGDGDIAEVQVRA